MVSEVRSKLCKNCAFPQNFHTRKLGGITVFYAVGSLALLEVPLNSFEIFITGHEYFKYHIFDVPPIPSRASVMCFKMWACKIHIVSEILWHIRPGVCEELLILLRTQILPQKIYPQHWKYSGFFATSCRYYDENFLYSPLITVKGTNCK